MTLSMTPTPAQAFTSSPQEISNMVTWSLIAGGIGAVITSEIAQVSTLNRIKLNKRFNALGEQQLSQDRYDLAINELDNLGGAAAFGYGVGCYACMLSFIAMKILAPTSK